MSIDKTIQVDNKHVSECLQETLKDMYGASMVQLSPDQQQLTVTVDDNRILIDLQTYVIFVFDQSIRSIYFR